MNGKGIAKRQEIRRNNFRHFPWAPAFRFKHEIKRNHGKPKNPLRWNIAIHMGTKKVAFMASLSKRLKIRIRSIQVFAKCHNDDYPF